MMDVHAPTGYHLGLLSTKVVLLKRSSVDRLPVVSWYTDLLEVVDLVLKGKSYARRVWLIFNSS